MFRPDIPQGAKGTRLTLDAAASPRFGIRPGSWGRSPDPATLKRGKRREPETVPEPETITRSRDADMRNAAKPETVPEPDRRPGPAYAEDRGPLDVDPRSVINSLRPFVAAWRPIDAVTVP